MYPNSNPATENTMSSSFDAGTFWSYTSTYVVLLMTGVVRLTVTLVSRGCGCGQRAEDDSSCRTRVAGVYLYRRLLSYFGIKERRVVLIHICLQSTVLSRRTRKSCTREVKDRRYFDVVGAYQTDICGLQQFSLRRVVTFVSRSNNTRYAQ
jgi:hypothetical protein